MKRIFIVFLSLVMILLAAGCGGQSSDKSKTKEGVSDVEEITGEAVDSISAKMDSSRSEINQKMNEVDEALNELE